MSRGGRFDNGNMKRERRSRSRSPHRGPPRRPGGPGDRDRRGGFGGGANDRMVFISNVSYDVRWMELKNLVREKGGEVNFVELLEDRDGKELNYVARTSISLTSKDELLMPKRSEYAHSLCITHCGFRIDKYEGGYFGIQDPIAFFRKVKEETGIDFLTKTGGGPMSRSRESESERPARTGTYDLFGLSPEFLRQHGIEPPLCDRVFIANVRAVFYYPFAIL
uniref:RRM domain-containing protein n=1 Tax=Heterorhabditis bacteriophora TaxID=37862 RepID=A0A1I7WVM9_HETBA